jgi:outer membrane receptor protein involved in Fe transport
MLLLLATCAARAQSDPQPASDPQQPESSSGQSSDSSLSDLLAPSNSQAAPSNPPADNAGNNAGAQTPEQSKPPASATPSPAPTEQGGSSPSSATEKSSANPASGSELKTIPVKSSEKEEPLPTESPARRHGLGTIEEIVVTAQKREEAINDVPIAISAFTGDALKDLGIQDTRDLGNVVPGFTYADSGYNTPIYQLRGVGFNEKSQTASSTVGVYEDEFNLPFPVLTKGANLDLDRVEVLKGPQGTLYGRNTTGGAVNYIAKKPTEEFEGGLSASVSRFLTADTQGFISGPVFGSLLGRFAVRDVRSGEGWQESITRHDDLSNDTRNPPPAPKGVYDTLGRKDNQAARLKLKWTLLQSLTFNLGVDWWRDHGDAQAAQAIGLSSKNPFIGSLGNPSLNPDVANYPTLSPDSSDNRLADWVGIVSQPWKLNDRFHMETLRTDWAITDSTTFSALGQYVDFKGDDALPSSGVDTFNLQTYQNTRTKVYAGEFRLAGESGAFHWLSGVYISKDKVSEFDNVPIKTDSAGFNVLPLGVTPIADWAATLGAQESSVYAVFGSTNWQVTQRLRLTLGARYTNETRKYRGCTLDSPNRTMGIGFYNLFNLVSLSQGGSGGIQDGDCVTLDAQTHNPVPPDGLRSTLKEPNVSGRVALDWTPVDGLLLYGSYGRGFKSGSYPILAASTSAQYVPATQEKLNAYELGNKSTLWDGRAQIDASVYYYDYKDKQLLGSVSDPIFGALPRLNNAPKSRVYGAELNLSGTPFPELYLAAAAAYVNTKVIEFSGRDEFGATADFAGRPFNYAPKLQYSLIGNYVYPLTERLDLSLGADYNHAQATNATLAELAQFKIPAYSVVNARLGIGANSGSWKLTAWGRNLTNAFIVNNVLNPGDDINRRVGMPITYGATLDVLFH